MSSFLNSGEAVTLDKLFDIMHHTDASEIPSSSIFVPLYMRELFGKETPYGTVSTTIILRDSAGSITVAERQW